jgi:hypothetical protein
MIMSKGPKVHEDVALFASRNVHVTARANREDACITYVLGELLKAKASRHMQLGNIGAGSSIGLRMCHAMRDRTDVQASLPPTIVVAPPRGHTPLAKPLECESAYCAHEQLAGPRKPGRMGYWRRSAITSTV